MNHALPKANIPSEALLKLLEGEPITAVANLFATDPRTLHAFLLERCQQICSQFEPYAIPFNDLIQTLDNIETYIFFKDSQGCYTYANRLACELFGLSLESIIGHTDADFFSEDTVDEIYKNDSQVLQQGKTIQAEEALTNKHTGAHHYYLTIKMPLYDTQGNVRGLCGISIDITERKQTENSLRSSQELLSTVVDNIGACVYMKSRDGRYLYANTALAQLVEKNPAQIIGHKDNEYFTTEVSQQLAENDNYVFNNQTRLEVLETIQTLTNDSQRYYWSVKVPLLGKNNTPYALLGISTDITERKRLEDQLRHLATTDELTGLNNRRYFLQLSEQTLNRSRRYNEPFTLLMCDIDFFKHINDTFGHATGDLVLQKVAQTIKSSIRDSDIAGRIGGEEFAILLVQTPILNRGYEVAERLRQAIESTAIILNDDQEVPLTISIGAVEPVYPHETLPTLLQRADQLLYKAKRNGRNQVC
ncbi:MAG: sensor domain-containing diguanylate cyclase [Agitococcus sp.]